MVRYTATTYTQKKYQQDQDLVDEVESDFPIDFRDPERHIEDKKNILKNILGYRNLRVGSNKSEIRFLPLDNCNPGRITRVLKGSYNSALNRIRKFGDPQKRNKNSLQIKLQNFQAPKQLSLFR